MEGFYQSLVAVEPVTLIVTVLNLFLQLFIIKKFFLKKIFMVLDGRQKAADAQIAEAENANSQAQELRLSYEKRLQSADAEAAQILQQAKKRAAEQGERIIEDAQKQAAAVRSKAEADIAREKAKVLNETKDEIVSIAVELAGRVVGDNMTARAQTRLVKRFMDGLGDSL